MDEGTFWDYLRKGMKGYWDAQRHEDKLSKGIPDVSYGLWGTGGWVELKYLHGWPKQEKTIVKIDHYTTEQRRWLRNRGKHTDHCWLFLRVGAGDFLLFDWQQAQMVGKQTKGQLIKNCYLRWEGRIDFEELARTLSA